MRTMANSTPLERSWTAPLDRLMTFETPASVTPAPVPQAASAHQRNEAMARALNPYVDRHLRRRG
jgi:hypothetical protein